MKLKQLLKSKQGIAIENAIMFMLVIFLICFLVTNLALIGHHQTQLESATLQRKLEIDQIGEDFIAYIKAGEKAEGFLDTNENYVGLQLTDYEITTDDGISYNKRLIVHHKKFETERLLYVELTESGEIVQWTYSVPTNIDDTPKRQGE